MIGQRPADESAAEALVQALCRMVDEIESTPDRRALLVRLLTERPSMRAYQRTTLVAHTEERGIAQLAARDGQEPEDHRLRALVAAVARAEERRIGRECGSTCASRWRRDLEK